jgi:hypothetical protein
MGRADGVMRVWLALALCCALLVVAAAQPGQGQGGPDGPRRSGAPSPYGVGDEPVP